MDQHEVRALVPLVALWSDVLDLKVADKEFHGLLAEDKFCPLVVFTVE